uniref:Uncharacterized protein n=1 Tax=Candidatus Kentrum sp. DK TaxID=2126562 RepID=A0A450THR8_9GAMM|nr:MAG: hypothetical protein BECKDK2373B_GA0170837_11782 [Candidatus Kentron sp. DK]
MQPTDQPPDILPAEGIVLVDLRIMKHADGLDIHLTNIENSLEPSDTRPRSFIKKAKGELQQIRRCILAGRGDALYQQNKARSGARCDGCGDLRKAEEIGQRMERLYPREQG